MSLKNPGLIMPLFFIKIFSLCSKLSNKDHVKNTCVALRKSKPFGFNTNSVLISLKHFFSPVKQYACVLIKIFESDMYAYVLTFSQVHLLYYNMRTEKQKPF